MDLRFWGRWLSMLLSSEIRCLRNLVSSEKLWRRRFPLQRWCNCMNVNSLTRPEDSSSIHNWIRLLSKLQLHVAMNEPDFPIDACVASRCIVQISRLICVFYFGENLEAIWAIRRRRLNRRICDADIGVLFSFLVTRNSSGKLNKWTWRRNATHFVIQGYS